MSPPLAGQHAHKGVRQALVLAIHPPNLARGTANVASWHISVWSDVAVQLCDEALHMDHRV